MNLDQIFRQAIEAKASDIHLAGGEIPRYRINGALVPLEMPALGHDDLSELIEPIFSLEAQAHLRGGGPVWRSALVEGISFSGLACRVGKGGLVITFRLLNNEIPKLEAIGFDGLDLLQWIIGLPRGLAVVAGPSLSGKTTTLCSMVEQINVNSPSRIFVITSEPSYEFISKAGMITNIQVGRDCRTYDEAMRTVYQGLDPDVIALDDLPTEEAVREAILLADTGHLVIANLHAQDSRDALSILMGLGKEGRKEYCGALATHLVAVTGQRLFRRQDRPGRAAAYDWLKTDDKLRELILSGDIESVKAFEGGRSRDEAIRSLVD
jgi:twitching motility protein PilT